MSHPYRTLAAPPARRPWWQRTRCRVLGHRWGTLYYDDRGVMSATHGACEATGLAHHSWRACERCGHEQHTRLYPSSDAVDRRIAGMRALGAAGRRMPAGDVWWRP